VSVYLRAWQYYRKHLVGWADVVIDEVNTVPFFAKYYVREPNILFVHQLCREIWFYQLPKVLGWVGYLAEPVYLRMLSDRKAVTVSESTRKDLMRFGFDPARIEVITQGITVEAAPDISAIQKYADPTLLSIGAIRAMKRTMDQVEAFEIAKAKIPNLKLKIAGDASDGYGKRVLKRIAASPYRDDIEYLGRVGEGHKIELMRKSHLVLQTAIKEGWGLTVTEAAAQGTPAIVYDVDGLRDSVSEMLTGRVVERSPELMAEAIVKILGRGDMYVDVRMAAWARSRELNFAKSCAGLMQSLEAT
jgi:glycosyltransferase involved in cell wall biosynthesis